MACLSLSLFLTRLAVYMYMYVAILCCNLGNGCDCLGLCSFHLTVAAYPENFGAHSVDAVIYHSC